MPRSLRRVLIAFLLLPPLALLAVIPLSRYYSTPLLLKLLQKAGIERPTLEQVSLGLDGLTVGKGELHWSSAQDGNSISCKLEDFRVWISWNSIMRAKPNTAYADKIDAKNIECTYKPEESASPVLLKGPVTIAINPDGTTGNISASGNVTLTKPDNQLSIPFNAEFRFDLSGGYHGLTTEGEMKIPKVNYSLPISNIRLHLGIEPAESADGAQVIRSSGGSFSILDGVVKLKPFKFRSDAISKTFEIVFQEINLETLLTTYPAGNVEGTGLLDGELKLNSSTSNAITASGALRARPPGGAIRGDLSQWIAAHPGNKNIALAALAVQNFVYSSLKAKLGLEENGDLTINLEMKGANPDLNNAQPINLNVNIEENLPALLHTMRLLGKG